MHSCVYARQSAFSFLPSEVATEVPFRLMHPQPKDPGQCPITLAFSRHSLRADLLRVQCCLSTTPVSMGVAVSSSRRQGGWEGVLIRSLLGGVVPVRLQSVHGGQSSCPWKRVVSLGSIRKD